MGSFYLFGLPIWEDAEAANDRREDREDRVDIKWEGKVAKENVQQEGRTDRTEARYADGTGPLADLSFGVSTPWGSIAAQGAGSPPPASSGALGSVDPTLLVGGGLLLAVVLIANNRK